MQHTPSPVLINETGPVVAPRWRNLYFIKDGRDIWAELTCDSEAECMIWSAFFFAEWRTWIENGGFEFVETERGLIPFEEIMFAIPFLV